MQQCPVGVRRGGATQEEARRPLHERARDRRFERLPVPAELVVYTERERARVMAEGGCFARTPARETVWPWPHGAVE